MNPEDLDAPPLVPFEEFLARPVKLTNRTANIVSDGLSGYFRKCVMASRQADIEIALIFADEPGSGALTRFLDKYEPLCRFYFESVVNERLCKFLERRGYLQVGCSPFVDPDTNQIAVSGDYRLPTELDKLDADALSEEVKQAQDNLFRQVLRNSAKEGGS